MGWLFLLAALLGLVFPPLAVVIMAMMIVGVFTKGVVADSPEELMRPRRNSMRRHSPQRPQDTIRHHVTAPRPGAVIDVRCYPVPPPPQP
jgi:hypothetical protein